MKYLIRAAKYFVYICVLVSVFLAILVVAGLVSADPDKMFRHGTDSLWQIALVFLVFSAIYPRFGFTSRGAHIRGEYSEVRDTIISFMADHGYRLEKEEGEDMTFRLRSPLNRLTRMFEDRITMTRELPGFMLEGPSKDVTRLIYGLESRFAASDNME